MGVLKFRFEPPDLASRLPELRAAYITGQDRTPGRTAVEIRAGHLSCAREGPESGRVNVPWPVPGFGAPVLATATLAERDEPYDLAVELARGRLNDLRNQAADWRLLGLVCPPAFDTHLEAAQHAFAKAATSRHDPRAANGAAQACLVSSLTASDLLLEAYTEQVLRRRQEFAPRLSTLVSATLDADPRRNPGMSSVAAGLNAARVRCPWARLEPSEGRFRWDEVDEQLAWCRAARLTPTAGPLIDLRPGGLPDWLWLWGGEFDQILSMVEDLVRQAVGRYRGKLKIWHLVHRVGAGEILGLTEEEQLRLTARAVQVARRTDPNAQIVINFDRPWGAWMASSTFRIGPFHLADALARLEIGLSGIGLEFAIGYGNPGSLVRDLLEFSRVLDLFAFLSVPLFVTLAFPAGAGPDPQADPGVPVLAPLWPRTPDDALQLEWASRWLALAIAKPYVRGVHWVHTSDAAPHLFPHAGLLRPDQSPRPLVDWMKSFRARYLE
jgi:hypothetical protein